MLYIMKYVPIMFVEYLWGIETSDKGWEFEVYYKFVEYLWGIETGKLKNQ